MILANKLGITDSIELMREEERISKKKAKKLFETEFLKERRLKKCHSLILKK